MREQNVRIVAGVLKCLLNILAQPLCYYTYAYMFYATLLCIIFYLCKNVYLRKSHFNETTVEFLSLEEF